MTISCGQLLLLLLALGSECTVEILRPLGTLQIQPLFLNAIYDEDTNMTSYIILFIGPIDIKDETGIPLLEVYRSPTFLVFKAEKQVKLGEQFLINFSSASTLESFRVLLRGRAVNGIQRKFNVKACIFEIKKEILENATNYFTKIDECQSKPEEDLQILNSFRVSFIDDQGHSHGEYEGSMKEYANVTSAYLSLNDKTMKRDNFTLSEAYFNIVIYNESNDHFFSYDWNVNLLSNSN